MKLNYRTRTQIVRRSWPRARLTHVIVTEVWLDDCWKRCVYEWSDGDPAVTVNKPVFKRILNAELGLKTL